MEEGQREPFDDLCCGSCVVRSKGHELRSKTGGCESCTDTVGGSSRNWRKVRNWELHSKHRINPNIRRHPLSHWGIYRKTKLRKCRKCDETFTKLTVQIPPQLSPEF